jgi:predicted NBD/HSP70 family sugar kinase
MRTTGDQQLVKRINRSVLLRLVRSQPGLSRAQLSQCSGLTKSTVGSAVRELIDEGWLMEQDSGARDGSALGRPSTPLVLSAATHSLVGVEVGVDELRGVCVSLTGDVLWSEAESLEAKTPVQVCRQVARLVSRAQAHLTERGLQMPGLGLGLPGAFDTGRGVLRVAPNLGWRDVAVADLLDAELARVGLADLPLHIQNEADTAALSEYEFDGSLGDALIFVTCDVGVGAGIILNDGLYPGSQGLAGEIGHSVLQMDGRPCSCGRRGCAETFIGARALDQEWHRSGSLHEAGRSLGVLLQNLWMAFDPSMLVLGGRSCEKHPQLVETACAGLAEFARSAGIDAPQVRRARYGLWASSVGAAALVMHDHLRPVRPVRPERRSAEQALA